MTAIAAIVENDVVWMAGDSLAATESGMAFSTSHPKVFSNGEFVFGDTGSFRFGQLLQYLFTPPDLPASGPDMHYMVGRFIPGLKALLRENEFTNKNDEREFGGQFLAGCRGKLYSIEADYQVQEIKYGYYAIGSGRDLALGSLYSTANLKEYNPGMRLMVAIEAAEEFCTLVRGPVSIVSTS